MSAPKSKIDTTDDKAWDKLLLSLPDGADYLQTSSWAKSKLNSPWRVSRMVVKNRATELPVQVFSRTVPGLGKLHYAPQITGLGSDIIPALTEQIRQNYKSGFAFKIEPYTANSEELTEAFKQNGWRIGNGVQYRHTVMVNLDVSEDELLASFKKRARYEIRIAQKNKIKVGKVPVNQANIKLFFDLIGVTAKRSGAFFRSQHYLAKYWHIFSAAGQGDLFFAWHGKDLVAGAFIIKFGNHAWYKDGASTREHANLMGSRLLQWEIMRSLKTEGIKHYDLCGIPAPDEFENSFMKGVYIFKSAFSRESTELMPALELPLSKKYSLWPKAERHFLRLYSGLRKDFWY